MSSHSEYNGLAGQARRPHPSASTSWLIKLGFKPQVTWRNATAFLIHCASSILFLVFLNASQPFLIHQLESRRKHGDSGGVPSRAGSLSGSLIFYDELLSTFMSLVWGALAELAGLAAVTSTSYLFIATGLVAYTLPTRPWPDLVAARLIFAIGGSGATAMLSGILSEYSGSTTAQTSPEGAESSLARAERDSEAMPEEATRPPARADEGTVSSEGDTLLAADEQEIDTVSPLVKRRSKHGRVAAIAGVFTGLGALVAVFVLVRLPEKIADYLEHHEHQDASPGPVHGSLDDISIRRATVGTFWLVAALALLVASVTALGLREPSSSTRRRGATDALSDRAQRRHQDYGALHDSTIALADDSRQARRARLRQRQDRRSQATWTTVIRTHVRRFISASIGGFRLAATTSGSDDSQQANVRRRLALELRMAYLGGALARAFTIGTTAFLPLLVTHHYYTSGLCRELPSPNPDSPLPNDELKKLCRSAFTATAILGGTAQLTALLASPLIGLACDMLSPTTTISVTSAFGAVGFYLLGVGTSGFQGDPQTGEETPDPLTALSIAAAVLVGLGQIGAIVASLASCARARSLIHHTQTQNTQTPDTTSTPTDPSQGTGAIAGAYTCTGSLSILLISKLGGLLFDMYVPSPFLLIAGFSSFVSLCGIAIGIANMRF